MENNKKIYALLVGINDYVSPVPRLHGCVNDVNHLKDYLQDAFDPSRLCIESLINSDATRENIIHLFRSHLGNAGSDDVVLFHYSGHGARSKSASEFRNFFPDGKDEGLVCYDSRKGDSFDLADKELAILLAELGRNNPHIAVLLDCCHSGSATRGADDFTQARARYAEGNICERPLESYLDGYYQQQWNRDESFGVPANRHILLSACEKTQQARENDHQGLFTRTLLDVLGNSGPNINYADLFVQARSVVRRYADGQTPQFETHQYFNARNGFLGTASSERKDYFNIHFDNRKKAWQANCGALQGLPSDSDKNVEFAIYRASDLGTPVGYAQTTQVCPHDSKLELLDFEAETNERFKGQITSLPVPPLTVDLQGDEKGVAMVLGCFDDPYNGGCGFEFNTDASLSNDYVLTAENELLSLSERETGRFIQGAKGYNHRAAQILIDVLKKIAKWERAVTLQNHATEMDKDDVEFQLLEYDDKKIKHIHTDGEITLNVGKQGDVLEKIGVSLRVGNKTEQVLHFAVICFSDDFSIVSPYNDSVEPTENPFDLLIGKSSPIFSLSFNDNNSNEEIRIIKLIVSTEKVDAFLIEQEEVDIGKTHDITRAGFNFDEPSKIHHNEWFTKTFRIRLTRQLDIISPKDATLANGRITLKGHSSLKADISLGTAETGNRGVGYASDFHRALERQGMEMLNFSATRGNAENILELTGIQNEKSLAAEPLEIALDFGLGEDETILPLTFDGQHILLAGETDTDEKGRSLLRINHIPDDIPDSRRSLGKALKLYFFKTYLKKNDVNKLCWVEYLDDGSVIRHEEGVKEKVTNANNILLLIHGIIGDTENIAEGIALANCDDGETVRDKFDLVLSYDYENLNTPIEKTARKLKKQLKDAGQHENDDKRLTLLVHSMGGLVSRWFIEQEGGNRMVDHLVMCGTPNAGSPFGKFGEVRTVTGILTMVAMNTFPALAPFGSGLLTVLGRSKKITPTLEQMNAESEFFQELNVADADPGIPYSIIAGDISDYREESGELVAELTAKIGKSALFDALYKDRGHDIAVSVTSIGSVPDTFESAAEKKTISCHHLNYFVSETGLQALGAVNW